MIDSHKEDLPNVVHLHDYHSVIPFIGMKQELLENGLHVSSIITIHLLTWPRFDFDYYKACGINESPISILLEEGLKKLTLKEVFNLSKRVNLMDLDEIFPTVEKIGAIVSDLVTTVSQSYLISDIIPNCGQELIGFKADFIWDGCDWDYDKLYKEVVNKLGEEIYKVLEFPSGAQINRLDMKKYLLTYKVGHLNQSPLINSQKVLETINEISNGNPFIRNGNIKAFSESGPLVLTTGRISPQKGFETIFESVPEVIKVVPNAKFIFLILPTDYSLNEIKTYAHFVKQYPNNIRIIFGVAADIFYLAHIAADVYCALSRWEPFGIMALEAMASKIPIIATKVGGLQETIVDVRLYPEIGTGILIEKNKPAQFAEALISLFKAAEVSERIKGTQNHTRYKTETLNIINQIPDEIIKSRVLIDPNYYLKIRENCYKRVKDNFTWKIVTKKLIDLYAKVLSLH
jgi:starch synthase